MEHDLSSVEKSPLNLLLLALVCGGIAVFLGISAVLLLAYPVLHASIAGWPPSEIAAGAAFAILALLLSRFLKFVGRGPMKVDVGDKGVKFSYRSGRVWQLDWRDPRFKLVIWDTTRGAPRGKASIYRYLAIGSRPRNNYLTSEAVSDLVAKARSAGLAVTEGIQGRGGTGTRIEGSDRA